MEDLFAPTSRLSDLYHAARERDDVEDDVDDDVDDEEEDNGFIFNDDSDREIDGLVELELITGSSAEDTFLCGFSWSDFYSWADGTMVWISPGVFFDLTEIEMYFQTEYRSFLAVHIVPNEEDTSQETKSLYVWARSEAHATVAADILLQLLPTCDSRKLVLESDCDSDRFPVSGLAFSHFLAQSRNLKVLDLTLLRLDTCHCRAIDALTRTDLRIDLLGCVPTESGEDIILECIRQNRGPTTLISCRMDTTRRLAGALRGNSSVTILSPPEPCSDEGKLVLVEALAENQGLLTLHLASVSITDEIWVALWQSLARHPKLEKLVLSQHYSAWRDGSTDAQKTLRMQAMVDALRVNTALHTIDLNRNHFDEEILDSTVYPLLLANMYRPRVGAITQVEGSLRCKLLGRALGSISSNPSLICMFFSGNANVRFGPTPPEEREGASL